MNGWGSWLGLGLGLMNGWEVVCLRAVAWVQLFARAGNEWKLKAFCTFLHRKKVAKS